MELVFDVRHAHRQRPYLQCLLRYQEVLSINNPMPSDQPQSYYFACLKGIATEPGLGNQMYLRILRGDGGDMPALEDGDGGEDVPALPGIDIVGGGSDSSGFGIAGGGPPVAPLPGPPVGPSPSPERELDPSGLGPPPLPPPPRAPRRRRPRRRGRGEASGSSAGSSHPPPEHLSSSSSSSNSDLASSTMDFVGTRRGDDMQVPGGPVIRRESYQQRRAGAYDAYVADCTHHGGGCHRSRGTRFTGLHGEIEPLAYLCAWNDLGAACSRPQHTLRTTQPSRVAVAEWAARSGADFLHRA